MIWEFQSTLASGGQGHRFFQRPYYSCNLVLRVDEKQG